MPTQEEMKSIKTPKSRLVIGLRLPEKLIAKIDMRRGNLSRQSLILRLIEKGLPRLSYHDQF